MNGKKSYQRLRTLGMAVCLSMSSVLTQAATLQVSVEIPEFTEGPYHRPYVAVWVENTKHQSVRQLAVWYEDAEWLKDIRRWWRKAGRYGGAEVDAVTSATRAPGRYTLQWDGLDANGQALPQGQYFLQIEAVREHGGRSQLELPVTLPLTVQDMTYPADGELGAIHITVAK